MMRLTLVISSLARGGAERVMSILASAWAEQGNEVTLLSFDHGEAPAYTLHSSVKRRSLGLSAFSDNFFQGLSRNFSRIRVLRRAIRQSQPDIVISFMYATNVLTLLATRGLGRPVIISERTDPSLYEIGAAWNTLRKLSYSFADALVCPTPASVARFQLMTGVCGLAIPNPIDVPPSLTRPDAPKGAPSAGHVMVAMGRLVPQKGFDLLLTALAQVANRHPDWKLTILGEGPLLNELQAQAESLHLQPRVHFAGAVADPFSRLRAADLFVFSSRFEGFGMALAEAMACGLPVVSFDCPEGPGAIIRHGVDGVLVPPGDVPGLAAVLDRLMGDAQERQRLAARAPEVIERFSAEKALSGWQELFDKLLPAKALPPERNSVPASSSGNRVQTATAVEEKLKPAPIWAKVTASVTRRLPRGKSRVIEGLFRGLDQRFLGKMAKELCGCTFDCCLRDMVARQVFFAGCFATQEIALVRALLQEGMNFVDVGANWGLFTLVAARLVGKSGRVVALEPDPRIFPKLRSNVERNGLNQVQVYEVAAADLESSLILAAHDHEGENWGVSRLVEGNPTGQTTFHVRSRRLDALLDEAGLRIIDMLKIDVEGAEDLVLRGMDAGLRSHRYRRILLELHPLQLAERGRTACEVADALKAKGYKGYALDYSPAAVRRAYYHPWLHFLKFIRPLHQGLADPSPHTVWLAPGEPDLM